MVNKGDKYVLHSSNGMDYKVEVVNVNYCRPPEVFYACELIDGNGVSYYEAKSDWYFCGDDFLEKCKKVNKN